MLAAALSAFGLVGGGAAAQDVPILVWAQPARSLAYWKGLGVNTVSYGEKDRSPAALGAFLDQAHGLGLKGVLALSDYDEALDRHAGMRFWRHEDEPDLRPTLTASGYVPRRTPDDLAASLEESRTSRTKPVWLNTTVRFLAGYRELHLDWYRRFYEQADWVGFDHYPVTGWNRPDRIPEIEVATRECRGLANGRPVLPILEVSDQNLAWTPDETRGPTAAELRCQIWLAFAGGARGIGYFPCAFRPFRWHVLTPEIEAELRRSNAEIRQLERFLHRTGSSGLLVAASSSELRIGMRRDGDDVLVLVVNRSVQQQRALLTFTPVEGELQGLFRLSGEERTPVGDVAQRRVQHVFVPLEAMFLVARIGAAGRAEPQDREKRD